MNAEHFLKISTYLKKIKDYFMFKLLQKSILIIFSAIIKWNIWYISCTGNKKTTKNNWKEETMNMIFSGIIFSSFQNMKNMDTYFLNTSYANE